MKKQIKQKFKDLIPMFRYLKTEDKIDLINEIKIDLHNLSPFKSEPVGS